MTCQSSSKSCKLLSILAELATHGKNFDALAPGDRIIGQDLLLQDGVPVGHDDEACTVGFARDVLCQAIVVLDGRGDVQASWSVRWPATGTGGPASFDGIIDGGTGAFRDAHGTFHSQNLPNGDQQITATIGGG